MCLHFSSFFIQSDKDGSIVTFNLLSSFQCWRYRIEISSKCSVTKAIRSDFNLTSSRRVWFNYYWTWYKDCLPRLCVIMCFCDKNVPTREVKPSHGVKTEYKGDNYTVFVWQFSRGFLIWRTFRKRSRENRVKSMMVAGRRKQSVRQHWGWVAAGYSTIPFLWQSHIIFYGLTLGPVIATNDGRVVVSLPRPSGPAHAHLCGK